MALFAPPKTRRSHQRVVAAVGCSPPSARAVRHNSSPNCPGRQTETVCASDHLAGVGSAVSFNMTLTDIQRSDEVHERILAWMSHRTLRVCTETVKRRLAND